MKSVPTSAATVPGADSANLESINNSINPSNSNNAMEQNNLPKPQGDDAIRRNTTVSIMALGATALLGFIVFAAVRQNTK